MLKPKKILENIPSYFQDEYFENYELKLDSNENIYCTSQYVSRIFLDGELPKPNLYPYYGELLDELSKSYLIQKNNFLLTNGCDEAINAIMTAYLEYGDNVVSSSPSFSMPKIYANLNGADFIETEYTNSEWEFELASLKRKINGKTKIIYLVTPNSLTGRSIKKGNIEYLLKKYPNKAVLVDVSYASFMDEYENYFELLNTYSNLIIVKSFSNDYALAGLRLATIISDFENIKHIKKVLPSNSVNSYAVFAGLKVLKDKNIINKTINEVLSSKNEFIKNLGRFCFKTYKSDTNFVLCDFGKYVSFVYKKLLINSIKVMSFENHKDLKNCLRITVPKKNDIEKVINTLNPKVVLVFNLDNVIFDIQNSYILAIKKTFEYFTRQKIDIEEIEETRKLGRLNSNYDLIRYLLKKYKTEDSKSTIFSAFQKKLFEKNGKGKCLFDCEKLILDKFGFEKLSKNYDLCIFTDRTKKETIYSLQRFGILKYFNMIVTKDDLPKDKQKPDPYGLNFIKENSYYKDIYYFGSTGDDILCARAADVRAIGVLPIYEQNETYRNFLLNKGAEVVINNISDMLKVKI